MPPNQNVNSQPNPNPLPTPEVPGQGGVESQPAPVAPEAAPGASQAAPPSSPPLQIPQIPDVPAQQLPGTAPAAAPAATTPTATPNPSIAADVDVIEKEWVDQANNIIEQTKDDPYVEEEAVEALQIDYLKKRYGHEVKKPDAT